MIGRVADAGLPIKHHVTGWPARVRPGGPGQSKLAVQCASIAPVTDPAVTGTGVAEFLLGEPLYHWVA